MCAGIGRGGDVPDGAAVATGGVAPYCLHPICSKVVAFYFAKFRLIAPRIVQKHMAIGGK